MTEAEKEVRAQVLSEIKLKIVKLCIHISVTDDEAFHLCHEHLAKAIECLDKAEHIVRYL